MSNQIVQQPDPTKEKDQMTSGYKPMMHTIQSEPSSIALGQSNKMEKRKYPWLSQTEISKKVRTVFLGMDKDGNGLMTRAEFQTLIQVLEVDVEEDQLDLIFGIIDKDGSGCVSFEEFFRYMMMVVGLKVYSEKEEDDMYIVKAFQKADKKNHGGLNFKELVAFLISVDQTDLIPKATAIFNEFDIDDNGWLEYEQFRDIFLKLGINHTDLVSEKEKEAQLLLKEGLRRICRTADTSKIAAFVEERWKKFVGMKRYDQTGKIVMTTGKVVKDFLPGTNKLSDMAFFSPLPVLPKHIVAVEGTNWRSKESGKKSGELTFTGGFDGVVPATMATKENLSYYGCYMASQSDQEYTLACRHGVVDFDFSEKYLEGYVLHEMGGSGIEKHEFDHLDCPLVDDSGILVIGKYVDDHTLHLTGFMIPKMNTVFMPAKTVHSNDYMRGTWRVMLSDEADIDHVQFVRYENGKKRHFHFTFQEV